MNRRSFLASMVAVSGASMLRGSVFGQSVLPATRPSSVEQAALIRTAALQFLEALAPDRRKRVSFEFPKGQSP